MINIISEIMFTDVSESLPCNSKFATSPLAPVISILPGEVFFNKTFIKWCVYKLYINFK